MNETVKNLITRKSCKSYKPEHISIGEIEEIIEAGLNAPTGRNLQTPIFVAVTDDETVSALSRMNAAVIGMQSDPFYGAKDVIIVLARKDGNNFVYDGSLAMGNLLNAAWSMGVGACWIHRAKEIFYTEEGKQLLLKWGIADDVEGIGFCILGREDKEKTKTEIKPNRVFYI